MLVSPFQRLFHFFASLSDLLLTVSSSVWARPDVLHKVTYLQQVVPRVLDYIENYTNFLYPLPKLDIFSIPSKEGAAFEGWGIIMTYEWETLLLVEDLVYVEDVEGGRLLRRAQ